MEIALFIISIIGIVLLYEYILLYIFNFTWLMNIKLILSLIYPIYSNDKKLCMWICKLLYFWAKLVVRIVCQRPFDSVISHSSRKWIKFKNLGNIIYRIKFYSSSEFYFYIRNGPYWVSIFLTISRSIQ